MLHLSTYAVIFVIISSQCKWSSSFQLNDENKDSIIRVALKVAGIYKDDDVVRNVDLSNTVIATAGQYFHS
jgi:hypothetical protein